MVLIGWNLNSLGDNWFKYVLLTRPIILTTPLTSTTVFWEVDIGSGKQLRGRSLVRSGAGVVCWSGIYCACNFQNAPEIQSSNQYSNSVYIIY